MGFAIVVTLASLLKLQRKKNLVQFNNIVF